MDPSEPSSVDGSDESILQGMGYRQELKRAITGFSNFALSFSIICILAGGVTSYHLALCGAGPASIVLGWPIVSAVVLSIGLTMAEIASALPTAGGLYHWASILGGKGWGWGVAWFNILGLIAALAAIDFGLCTFASHAFGLEAASTTDPLSKGAIRSAGLGAVLLSQALVNAKGVRAASLLTDFSGYLIVILTIVLSLGMLLSTEHIDWSRLSTFTNYSGASGGWVWPGRESLAELFVLGFLLPAYTLTGFDASAHAAEETFDAAVSVPKGIVRSIAAASVFGWLMLTAVVVSTPSLDEAAARGEGAFAWSLERTLPGWLHAPIVVGIVLAMYACGLGALVSASRTAYAFARDGGLPFSNTLKRVHKKTRAPTPSIATCALAAWMFTLWTPVYGTISVVTTTLLYISYVTPTALGVVCNHGRWPKTGRWRLGRWRWPLAVVSVLGCGLLVIAGVQPPNARALWVLLGLLVVLPSAWFLGVRRRFPGPPSLSCGNARENHPD